MLLQHHRPIAGRLVIATHNPGKLAEMRELLAPYGIAAVSAAELGLPSPRRPARAFAENARIKAAAAAKAAALAGLRRRFRPRGRCARRRARHLFGALGGARQGLPPAPWARSRSSCSELGATAPEARTRALHLGACASPGPTAMSKTSKAGSTARWCGRRAATKASATIRCSCPTAHDAHLRRDAERGEARPAAGQAAASPTAPAPSAPRGGLPWQGLMKRAPPRRATAPGTWRSASMSTGRSACRNAPIATSTAMSATPRSTRRGSCARSRPRSLRRPRARPAARCRRSSSAAARRR